MKFEGGSFVKSPWYYRTGARPLGVTRLLSYVATGVAAHTITVRAQTSVTSTLNVYVGNVQHNANTTVAGTAAGYVGTSLTFDSSVKGFNMGFNYTNSPATWIVYGNSAHIDEFLTNSGDTIYLCSFDERGGAGVASYQSHVSVEWFGK